MNVLVFSIATLKERQKVEIVQHTSHQDGTKTNSLFQKSSGKGQESQLFKQFFYSFNYKNGSYSPTISFIIHIH